MPQQEVDGFEDMRRKANGLSGALAAFSTPWWKFCTVAGTAGYTLPGDLSSAVGLGVLALFAAAGQSEILAVTLAVALLSQAEHRWKSRRSESVHSRSIGVSHFARFFGGRARAAEVGFAALIGLGCLAAEDQAAGCWYLLAAVGHALTVGFAERRREVVEDAINDARLEMAERSYRRPASRARKPWEH